MTTNISPGEDSGSLVMMVGRHQTMTPSTTKNLDGFIDMVGKFGKYLLAPAHFVSETEFPHIGLDLAILKDQLIIRNAWEISRNDIDSVAFVDNDDPLIPSDITDAPVTALLEAIREFARRR